MKQSAPSVQGREFQTEPRRLWQWIGCSRWQCSTSFRGAEQRTKELKTMDDGWWLTMNERMNGEQQQQSWWQWKRMSASLAMYEPHVLHWLLPPLPHTHTHRPSIGYALRPWPHEYSFPNKDDQNFIPRFFYRNRFKHSKDTKTILAGGKADNQRPHSTAMLLWLIRPMFWSDWSVNKRQSIDWLIDC